LEQMPHCVNAWLLPNTQLEDLCRFSLV